MKNGNDYPEKEKFGRFNLNLKALYEKTELLRAGFESRLKTLRDCRGTGWHKSEAEYYLITGRARIAMFAYSRTNGHTRRTSV